MDWGSAPIRDLYRVEVAELSLIRARMEGGKRDKALRGALYSARIPIGFVRDGETLRKDPDARIQAAIATVMRIHEEYHA